MTWGIIGQELPAGTVIAPCVHAFTPFVEPASLPAALPSEFVEYNTGNGMYAVAGDKVWFVTGQARVFKSDDRDHNWYVVGNAFSPAPPANSGPNSIAFKDSLNGIVVSY
jgi:hypothetical protein